jgi:uncharacterized protein (UPF0332 family)
MAREKLMYSPELLGSFEKISSERYSHLLRLAQEGLFPESELEGIIEAVTIQRYQLAEDFRASAQAIVLNSEIDARNVISRNYYAMYQAARSVVFHVHRQDLDNHELVARKIGPILGSNFQNLLDDWRRYRNRADYSPFPRVDLFDTANQSNSIVSMFSDACKQLLQQRGVPL